ncbi:hypothetical protein E2320_019493 [Naja naja]|nr:hypothetical protein E2320_019493 [Naja naja]
MEESLHTNSFNQEIRELYVDKPPQLQEAGETLPKDFQIKEGLSHSQEELCRDDAEDCRGIESFGRKEQTFETDIESKDEQLGWLDTRRSEEISEIASHENKTCSVRDGSKFHPTEEMDRDHPIATWEKEDSKDVSVLEPGISNQTLQEFTSVLKESPLLSNWTWDSSELRVTSCHALLKSREEQCQCMETLPPHLGSIDQKIPIVHMHGSGKGGKSHLGYNSAGLEKQPSKSNDLEQPVESQQTPFPKVVRGPPTNFEPTSEKESRRGSSEKKLGSDHFLHFTSEIEHIEEQMARDNVHFIRFETTDIHGVSRSKSIPSRFFRTKAIYGVAMPKGYLELTLNPRDHETCHVSASSFNCDIILRPDLSTFRILPWMEQTARVICDPFMVMGNPLLTSPRYIAKQQLNQLWESGFALYSAFTYEFCVYGIAEIVNSKTISFPAATLLSNHDQSFIQELMDGMYHAGANIESFSSSAGPGQMEISFHPEFGLGAADSAFTFRTGIKEVAKKYNYIASFFTENGFYNSGILTHSLWDSSREHNLFASGAQDLTEIGKNWLAGLLTHSAALSCLMAPTVTCRKCYSGCSKGSKESVVAKGAWNDNSCAFNIQNHGDKGTWIENQLGSATANPYLVLSATIAAGLDGVKRKLTFQETSGKIQSSTLPKAGMIPLKLEDALVALQEDECIRNALGDYFVQYFVNIKQYEVETEELDVERNKFLEYFI